MTHPFEHIAAHIDLTLQQQPHRHGNDAQAKEKKTKGEGTI
jgi:hypothetical protein